MFWNAACSSGRPIVADAACCWTATELSRSISEVRSIMEDVVVFSAVICSSERMPIRRRFDAWAARKFALFMRAGAPFGSATFLGGRVTAAQFVEPVHGDHCNGYALRQSRERKRAVELAT